MKTFEASLPIRASKETIWKILTDAPSYQSWNTTVDKVDGRIALNEKITVHPKNAGGRAFPAKVAEFVPQEKMIWAGGMPLGLFKGVRTFTLTDRGEGTVEFRMGEVFSGLLSPLIERSMPDLQPASEEVSAALKKDAEKAGS